MSKSPSPFGLIDLPNLGSRAVSHLVAAGIKTPQGLRRMGAVAAALRIRKLRPTNRPGRKMLVGLQGAIRGVRWRSISEQERERLWRRYQRRINA